MKAIGGLQSVGAAHFVERVSLLTFLDEMMGADSVAEALQLRLVDAESPPAPKPLRVPLPAGLRNVMLRELPENIRISPGRIEITAPTAIAMLESLVLLAQAMQNDITQVQFLLEPPQAPPNASNDEMQSLINALRRRS